MPVFCTHYAVIDSRRQNENGFQEKILEAAGF
jgi:hypothetical protein